jgi:ABC-2 type transport system permease protein
MRDVWLVARREYAHFVLRRGFIFSMLAVPIWIAVSALLPILAARAVPTLAFAVVDRSGAGLIASIDVSLERSRTRDGLNALSLYAAAAADMTALKEKDPELHALLTASSNDRTQVDAALAQGGIEKLRDRVTPFLKPNFPRFELPAPKYLRVEATPAINGATAQSMLRYFAETPDPPKAKLSAVLVIPEGFGKTDAAAQLWVKDLSSGFLQRWLEQVLTERQQRNAMEAAGVDPVAAREIVHYSARVERFDASPEGRGQPQALEDRIRNIAPLGLAGILFFVVFLSSTMLLGSVIEDKSSRVVEVLLSCVTSNSLVAGKLIGAAGAALTIVVIWAGALTALTFLSGDAGPLVRTGVGAVLRPDFLPLAIVLFVLAFLIYCSMFLIAGSVAKTPQDAQAYVGPLMIVVFLPFFFIMVLLVDPNGWLAQALTYIPIYSPFILMMRLTSSPPVLDVAIGTGIAAVTAIGMLWLAARVYRRNAVPIEGGPPRA